MGFWGYLGGAVLLAVAGGLTGGAAWIVAGAGAFMIAKPTLEKWANTPKNEAQKLGVEQEKLEKANKEVINSITEQNIAPSNQFLLTSQGVGVSLVLAGGLTMTIIKCKRNLKVKK